MDPTSLINHPVPVRNIILQIPAPLLNAILTHHAEAYQPMKPTVTNLTPKGITISYLQPLKEPWANPIPRTAKIAFNPPLAPVPQDSAPESEAYAWESACAARLREMEEESIRINEGRSPIIVTRYLPPTHFKSWMSILQFIVLTGLIYAQIRYKPAMLEVLFEPEWKFNATVLVHAGILVKKARDVMNMNDKLRKHQVDKLPGNKWVGPWIAWIITAAFEGWRCPQRFDEEVARIGREMATKDDKKGK